MSKNFWINWLKIASVIVIIVGLIAAAASTQAGSLPWLFIFDLLKWPIDGNPSSFQADSFALNAVLGGVMAGWAVLIFLLVSGPVAKGDFGMLRYLLTALIVFLPPIVKLLKIRKA